MKGLKYFLLSLTIFGTYSAGAQTLTQAKKWFNAKEYSKALPVFKKNLASKPKNAEMNNYVGACLYETGNESEAVKYLEFAASKDYARANAYMAIYKFKHMDYQAADSYLTTYNDLKDDELDIKGLEKTQKGILMLNNVEKIEIIDSLIVDKADFFKHYKLSSEAGSLHTTDILPYEKPDITTTVFLPESKQRMIWAMTDSIGQSVLAETYKLTGGTWDKYTYLSTATLNNNGEVNYPFFLADGITLYYCNDGENSIGGYDIFKTRKDAITGEYMEPQNLGYPYNSPYDDYLLAIDEMTGVGWWASDRNRIPGKVTIYIFKPNSFRSNYDPDSDDVYSLAAVTDITKTWKAENYNDLIQTINSITPDEEEDEPDFIFHINNKVTYTKFENFNSNEARELMVKRIKLTKFLDEVSTQLEGLRIQFHKAKASLKHNYSSEIVTLERTIVKNSEELQKIDNAIRAAEIPTLKSRK